MKKIATASQAPALLHRPVSRLLLHPLLIRVRRESCQIHPPSLQVDEEQHIVGRQPFERLDFRREEVHSTKTSKCARIKVFHETDCLRFGTGGMPWRPRTVANVR